MMRLFAMLIGASLISASPVMAQDENNEGMLGIKIAVADFQKTIDFYTVLGMKTGQRHNALEWELTWDDPVQGSNVIMVQDESNRMQLVPGGAFLIMIVPDVEAVAVQLRRAGHPNVGKPRQVMQKYTLLMLRDPDGNQIELLAEIGPSGSK